MNTSFNGFKLTNPAANDWQYQTFSYDSSAGTVSMSLEGTDAAKVDFTYNTGNKTLSFRAKDGVVGPGGQATVGLVVKSDEDGSVTRITGTGQVMATNLFALDTTLEPTWPRSRRV